MISMISRIYHTAPRHITRPPILHWTGLAFEFYNGYTHRDQLKQWGFTWCPELKVWWTDDSEVAVNAFRYANAETKALLLRLFPHLRYTQKRL